MHAYVMTIRRRLFDCKNFDIRMNVVLGRLKSFKIRAAFMKWRMVKDEERHEDEVDTIGPQCKEVLLWQQVE